MMPEPVPDELGGSTRELQHVPKAAKASADLVEQWREDFKSIGWGQENYERAIRKSLEEPLQLEEGESIVFAASSGGWLVWVQSPDDTEAGMARAIAGTNRRLIIWTSRAHGFELSRFRELRYRDLKEVRELAELRIGRNVHRFDGIVSISFREKDESLGVLVGRNATGPLLDFLNAASGMPMATVTDFLQTGVGSADHHLERRGMLQNSLLQQIEDLARKVKLLEREKREAVARAQELEREQKQAAVTIEALQSEVGELGALISAASEKVAEIMKEDTTDYTLQRRAVNAPAEASARGQLGESSAAPKTELKERSSKAYRFD